VSRIAIKGVLFDKDGTLFDFAGTWREATRGMLATLAPGDTDMQNRMGRAVGFDPVTGAFVAGSPVVAGSVDAIARIWAEVMPGLDVARIEAHANLAAGEIGLLGKPALAPATDDLPGLLAGLRDEGFALGVATHDGEAAARGQLAAAGALGHFAFVCGYDSGFGLKPGPGMVTAFARAVGIAAGEVAMVGDSVHDLAAARAAGAALALGVLTGPATEADLAPHADAILPSIAALPGFLRRYGL
jgi:phosphoglycolate phosphatase